MPERSTIIASVVYLIVSLVCTQVPLLNYLGYEFSALIALVSSIGSLILTVHVVRARVTTPPIAFFSALTRNLILLLIPLVVMLTNALFVRNCSPIGGLFFFLLLPVVSCWFSTCVGFFCALHYTYAKIIALKFFAATILYAIYLGYFTPAVFAYNVFLGFFPGLTYDELLSVTPALVYFRVFTVALGGVFLWMGLLLAGHTQMHQSTWSKGKMLLRAMTSRGNVWKSGLILAILIAVYLYRCELGFESTASYIRETLGDRMATEHVIMYYSPESCSEEEAHWVVREHEFQISQILKELHISSTETIESYVYPSASVKKNLMGAGSTNIAKPWTRQIHVTQQSLEGTLKHELVHVLAGEFGMPVIRANLNTALVEGLAMALEWNWGNRTLHQYAAALLRFDKLANVASILETSGFVTQSSSTSYVIAGSFCRYLIDRYGIRLMLQAYRGKSFYEVYGKKAIELADEWKGFLHDVEVDEQERDVVDVFFRRPSIFGKVCARVIAARNAEAADAQRQNYFSHAANLYLQSYDESRGMESLAGHVASSFHGGNDSAVIAVLDTIVLSGTPSQFLSLFNTFGLALWTRGNSVRAEQLFVRVAKADVHDNLTESALIWIGAMRDSANQAALCRYARAVSPDSVRLVMLDSMVQNDEHWVPVLLKARLLLRIRRWKESSEMFERLAGSIPVERLEASRLRLLGTALFRQRRFDEAKVAFWASLNHHNSEWARVEMNEWVERCDWMSNAPQ